MNKKYSSTKHSDLSECPYVTIGRKYEPNTDKRALNPTLSLNTRRHQIMGHTTTLDTCQQIFKNKTFRCNNLANTNLNDLNEKQRLDLDKFSKHCFISCFCHSAYEVVPFWIYYGCQRGKKEEESRKNKVLLQFRNFAKSLDQFNQCIYTDHALFKGEKVPFTSRAFEQAFFSAVSKPNTHIDSLQIMDVNYKPTNFSIFKQRNCSEIPINSTSLNAYYPGILGLYKTKPWSYEKESRIIITTPYPGLSYEYIDLRLKPEIFRGLKIILSPWADDSLERELRVMIQQSGLPEDIMNSIKIKPSCLTGQINIPTFESSE